MEQSIEEYTQAAALTLRRVQYGNETVYYPTQIKQSLRLSEEGFAMFMGRLEYICSNFIAGKYKLPDYSFPRTIFHINEEFEITAHSLFIEYLNNPFLRAKR